jgi:hypothetical protein
VILRHLCIGACALALASPAAAQLGRGVPDEAVEATLDHWPETNESRHDLWYESIAGRGGAFLGVGSDQCYSLAAVQNARAIFLVDYDPVVSRIHRALGAIIRRCPDAGCLARQLRPEQEATSASWIATELGDGWEAQQVVRTFVAHRPLLARRMARLSRERDTWVSRPDWYLHMHRAFAEGRVVARTADLRGPSTIRAMADAARREGLLFEVLYLSNAEEYFSYNESFIANLQALPVDDSAIVLRTLRDQRLARAPGDHAWHYGVQPLSDLMRRITREGYADSSYIVRDLLSGPGRQPFSRLDPSVESIGEPGPRRWWLDPGRPRPAPRARGESRLLRTYARAIRAPIDLADTGLADYSAAAFPIDPRTGERYRLSGEPTEAGPADIGAPEDALLALLMDAVTREVLPPMLRAAGLDADAEMLERAPAVVDLYGAYRLRERLLEVCPADRRAPRGNAGVQTALSACRAASRLVRPVATRRAQPTWSESEGRIAGALRVLASGSSRLTPGDAKLVETLERLATIARAMTPR